MTNILVIDDDTELCELLIEYLAPEGFEVEAVHAGETGAERALTGKPDLIVLDVMLPGMNGFDVLKKIRSESQIPVLMLTARGDDVDRIVGLELGADDYLPKPFNPRELVARIRAIQRRATPNPPSDPTASPKQQRIATDDIELNPATRKLLCKGERVELTAVEFSLLYHLLQKAGDVVSRDELAIDVLGRTLEMFDRSIDVHVSSLRKKLGPRPDGQERIVAIRGVGYQYLIDEEEAS